MNKKAFTLAEILIVLGLIGFVGMMMLPIIRSAKPNKNKALFRKAYYVVERITNELKNDDDTFSREPNKPKVFASRTDSETIPVTGNRFCTEFGRKLDVSTFNCGARSTENINKFYLNSSDKTRQPTPTFVTTDGISWLLSPNGFCDPNVDSGCSMPATFATTCPNLSAGSKVPYMCIMVDVNGFPTDISDSQGPNTTIMDPETDRFTIYILYDGRVVLPKNSPAATFSKSASVF